MTSASPNFDNLRERLRERITEAYDDYDYGYCGACEAQLTSSDWENDECSQCGAMLVKELDDESVDEHLYDD
jgi:hypothetical protein